jgi:hypothetical protein
MLRWEIQHAKDGIENRRNLIEETKQKAEEALRLEQITQQNSDLLYVTSQKETAEAYAKQLEGVPDILTGGKPEGYNPSLYELKFKKGEKVSPLDLRNIGEKGVMDFGEAEDVLLKLGIKQESIDRFLSKFDDEKGIPVWALFRGELLPEVRQALTKGKYDIVRYTEGLQDNILVLNKDKLETIGQYDVGSLINKLLVPDAIKRSDYLDKLQQSGIKPEVIKQADDIIQAWQDFNHARFSEPILKQGQISDETFVRFMEGTHLKRAYETYNNSEKFLSGVIKNGTVDERLWAIATLKEVADARKAGSPNKIPLKDLVERKALSDETMKKMGLITDAEYNVMNTVKGSSHVLRSAEYLENVGKMFGKTEAEIRAMETAMPGSTKGFTQLDSKAYGKADKLYVPDNVKADIDNVVNGDVSMVPEFWQKAVGVFKIEKLLDVPPIFRNMYSGFPMANTFGNVPLVDRTGSPMAQSITDVTTELFNAARGKQNTLFDTAREIGLLDSTWTRKEAEALLNYEGEFMKAGLTDKIKWLADKGMTAFGSPDKFWRLVVFNHHLDEGRSIEEAANIAKRALLDYNKAPVWVNFLSKSGLMPFARFPWLAGVETARALYNNPASVTKYTKPFKGEETDDRGKVLPKYLKGNELLPIGTGTRTIEGKTTKVQEHLDMNYILPFFNEFYLGNPLLELLQLYRTGKNNMGMTVVRPEMSPEDKARAYGKYIKDSFGPSITSSYGWPAKLMGAVNNEVDYKGRMYAPKDVAMQTVGLKNVPVNYQREVDKRETEMKYEAKNIKAEMRRVEQEYERKYITKQQRDESLRQYERELAEIDKKYFEMRKAFKRFKDITK